MLMSVGKSLVPESSGKSTAVTSRKTQDNSEGELCFFQHTMLLPAHSAFPPPENMGGNAQGVDQYNVK